VEAAADALVAEEVSTLISDELCSEAGASDDSEAADGSAGLLGIRPSR